MKKILIVIMVVLHANIYAQPNLTLTYRQPARSWNEALPLGNGRLGAMVFGNVTNELIQLNESTLWSGGPVNANPNPQAIHNLPAIRAALAAEDFPLAEKLTSNLQGPFTESYEPLGDLKLDFSSTGEVSNYSRELNISTAIATTRYMINGVVYSREMFSSAADQLLVIRLSANEPAALNFSLTATSQLHYQTESINEHELLLSGKAPSHTEPSYVNFANPVIYVDSTACRGMRFALKVKLRNVGGQLTATNGVLKVERATEVVLYISAATSFNGFDKCPDKDGVDEQLLAERMPATGWSRDYWSLRKRHIADYQKYFNRVTFILNGNPPNDFPTDERLVAYTGGTPDPALEALYFQFGRYLLISSSRPGGMPANLQGIWNHHVRPPWSSNYTTNINTEMNYWMAESCNLSELHLPLLDHIRRLSVTGAQTTKNFYGARGWTVHHNTDVWALSNPVNGSPSWANWPMGGPWLCRHLWEHYAFTMDMEYLRQTAYPLMKDAAVFCLDWLVENKEGKLITSPSTSPENIFVTENGFKGSVSVASTMDMSVIRDLFTNVVDAAAKLETDTAFSNLLKRKIKRLFPLQIGRKGNLQEWYKDWEDAEPTHRHISHLFGLFPGCELSPMKTPELAMAARRSLELRGDEGTGWSKGWKINVWARLLDGNHAYKLLRQQLTATGVEGTNYSNAGGTYPNLLDAHPPFQIDGNFGGVSGMTEMLLQSQSENIHLLAALPDVWKSGVVSGLRARGGFEVDMEWKTGSLVSAKVKSHSGSVCRIFSRTPFSLKGTSLNSDQREGGFQMEFPTKKGQVYTIIGK